MSKNKNIQNNKKKEKRNHPKNNKRNKKDYINTSHNSPTPQSGDFNSIKYVGICLFSVFGILLLALGLWDVSRYNDLKNNCTKEIKGVIDRISEGEIDDMDYADTQYLTNDDNEWIHIRVVNDDGSNYNFTIESIYANAGIEELEEIVTIHYDPENTERYYIADRVNSYRTESIILFVISGINLLWVVLIIISLVKNNLKNN